MTVRRIRCLSCDTLITSGDRLIGCNCDCDAPTWCALDGDEIIALSHAHWVDVID